MSEQRLRDLGREAQDLVDLPDLGALERRGRALRFRRQVGVVAAAAVLAATGAWLVQDRSPQAIEPAPAPDNGLGADPWPSSTMRNVAAGTYELFPSAEPTDPTALITVPRGWNAWRGPNRFDGHAKGRSNEEALGHRTWYVGVLVLKVTSVTGHACAENVAPDEGVDSYQATVDAIARIPGYDWLASPRWASASATRQRTWCWRTRTSTRSAIASE